VVIRVNHSGLLNK